MVKILSLSFALAAFGMAVMAQEPASSSTSSTAAPASSSSTVASSAPASSSSEAPASSSQPTSSSSSSSSAAAGGDSKVCSILVGAPNVHPADCTYSSTYTPPYDQSSIVSYLLGGYKPGVEATPIDVAATSLAGDVLKYYPTLTVSQAQLAGDFKSAISASIKAGDYPAPDSAITNKALSYAAVFAAVVAGGAFVL